MTAAQLTRHPDFRLLWGASLVNRLGTFVQPFLTLWLTGARHRTVSSAGLALACVGAGSLLGEAAGGTLADRWGRRPTVAAGMLAAAAATLALLHAPGPAVPFWAVAVGFSGQLWRPAVAALISDLLSPEDWQRGFALQAWAINLGLSASTASAGVLIGLGWSFLFWADALTCLGAAALIWAVREPPRLAAPRPSPSPGADPLLVALCALVLGYGVIYTQAFATLPLRLRADVGDPRLIGLVLATNPVVIVLGTPLVVCRRPAVRPGRSAAVAMGLVGAGFSAGFLVRGTAAHIAAVAVWSVGEILVSLTLGPLVARLAPAGRRGRYQGAVGVASGASFIVGPLAGSRLASSPGVLAAASLGLGACLIWGFLGFDRHERTWHGKL